jgi:LuxR family maltose regulon positive regulatory protein
MPRPRQAMVEGTLIEAESGQRYVIERPRLTKLLDESNARIILLVAPAGYGKTTLARQWLTKGDRKAAWVRATPASRDVAALAPAIAHALEPYLPGIERQLLRHLQAVSNPELEAVALGSVLVSTGEWPQELWLVIDDYHVLASSAAAEALIESLLEGPTVRLLVTSREAPTWATARRVIYGELLRVERDDLAFTQLEAGEVLSAVPRDLVEQISARSRGWPAVVRMAALTRKLTLPDILDNVALHRYFAEELFSAASENLQRALLYLAAVPTITSSVRELLPSRESCDEAVRLGFLSRNDLNPGASLELHPLLRTFLERKLKESPEEKVIPEMAFERALSTQSWDDAYAIATQFDLPALIGPLLTHALPAMLASSRLTTLREWCDWATTRGARTPMVDVAEAEIARRTGDVSLSISRAKQAIRTIDQSSPHLSRAHAVAAECFHIQMLGESAFAHARLAEQAATNPADARRAIWAQLIAAAHYEQQECLPFLERFEALSDSSPGAIVRDVAGRLVTVLLEGHLPTALAEAEAEFGILDLCEDVVASTSLLYRMAYINALVAQYDRAIPLAERTRTEAARAAFQPAAVHITAALAAANIGLRRFRRAEALLDMLGVESKEREDAFEQANWHALRARLQISLGASERVAKELANVAYSAPTPGLKAELLGLRAVALAASSAPQQAVELAQEGMRVSAVVDGQTLSALALAIAMLHLGDSRAPDYLVQAATILEERGNYDSLVVAARAFPPLIRQISDSGLWAQQQVPAILTRSRDFELMAQSGWDVSAPTAAALLTRREREVFRLLAQGLTNREIARALYISEATVKVHVRHILEKIGARSRAEAVAKLLDYAREIEEDGGNSAGTDTD